MTKSIFQSVFQNSYPCVNCNKFYQQIQLTNCNNCGFYICESCVGYGEHCCVDCKEFYCKFCQTYRCSECNGVVCKNCKRICFYCGAIICYNCFIQEVEFENCMKRYKWCRSENSSED